jgi:hypothetical protein
MHRVTGVLGRVRYRVEGRDLRLRVQLLPGASIEGVSLVVRVGPGDVEAARVPLDRAGEEVEMRAPLMPGTGFEGGWRLDVERGGAVEERAPGEGSFPLPAPREEPPGA